MHFTSNTLQPMGTSLLRLQLLRALGWKVVSVPFYDWCQLDDDKRGKVCNILTTATPVWLQGGGFWCLLALCTRRKSNNSG